MSNLSKLVPNALAWATPFTNASVLPPNDIFVAADALATSANICLLLKLIPVWALVTFNCPNKDAVASFKDIPLNLLSLRDSFKTSGSTFATSLNLV